MRIKMTLTVTAIRMSVVYPAHAHLGITIRENVGG